MKKVEQENINMFVFNEYKFMEEELFTTPQLWKRLKNCQAYVLETKNYYILKSYNTIVAWIEKEHDTLYDALRMVYGYTATSAQHISKFEKAYCSGKWNCVERFTYRDI